MIVRLLICTLVLSLTSCTWSNRESTAHVESKRTSVTETTKLREVFAPDGSIAVLEELIFTRTISDEVADERSKHTTSVPVGSTLLGLGAGVSGLGPIADVGMTILTFLTGKKIYNTVRDAPPREPKPQKPQVKARREEDE